MKLIEKDYSTDDVQQLLKELDDPVFFANNVLGVQPWSKQEEFLRLVAQFGRVAHKSGHKVSKSHSLAILALWWVVTREDARVCVTSASFHQVTNIVWREITQMYYDSIVPIGGKMYRDPAMGLKFKNGNEIFGFSTDQPERAAGISAANILYLIDEASGVDEPVFEAMEGNMAAGAKMVMCSNPTRTSGLFFDAFHSKRKYWHLMTTSSKDSPNVTGEREVPGLARWPWIEEMAALYGEDSPFYHVRIAGDFPGQGSNAVIGLEIAERARRRYADASLEGALRVGIDVARYGDDETVIQAVRGIRPYKPEVFFGLKGHEVAGEALNIIDKLRRNNEETKVKVDAIGLGTSPTDFLEVMDRAKSSGVIVRPVTVSEVSDFPEKYHDLRTQLCFELRNWLDDEGSIPDDQQLMDEMVSPTYGFDVRGRMQLDSKDAERKLLGRSPDRRNALELAIYEARPRRTIGAATVYM